MSQLDFDSKNVVSALFKHTEFQVYTAGRGVVDLTEKRLVILMKRADTEKKRNDLDVLLQSYRDGDVVVAWRDGKPIFKRVAR